MKSKREMHVRYSYVACEQKETQKRLDDAFDSLFEGLEMESIGSINNENNYEHATAVNK
jgi:hypothetical protein